MSQILLLGVIQKYSGLSGYQIIKKIKNITDNTILLKAGTIYPQLDKLEKQDLVKQDIESVSESTHMKKATYTITKKGSRELQLMISKWNEFKKKIELVID